ncbi:Dual oxidase maturation factor 1, partial [Eschrichtius robustus]|nr:Dual oxidase maturation factor 1 [Eschrichtius robustus]
MAVTVASEHLPPLNNPTKMAAFGHTFPSYAGPKSNFPMVTTLAVIIAIFLTSLVTFIIILPGIRGKMVSTNTSNKAFSSEWISTAVGLQIGLGGVNITLTGTPVQQLNETGDYNKEFTWRLGENHAEEYAKALEKRLPDPVLYLAEKFTLHGPRGLHGQYHLAGHYTSGTLWVAFLCWLLADVMLSMPVLVYGGHMLLATGVFQLLGLLFFSTAMSLTLPCPLRLGTATLPTHRGPAFWITLTTGLLCVLLGLAMVVAHRLQAFFSQTVGEDPVLEWDPEGGGLLSPRYGSTAGSPEPQDIPRSEASSEVPSQCPPGAPQARWALLPGLQGTKAE